MWEALAISAAVIFVAELGDKSQLLAIAFAGRYRVRDVLIGITLATTVVHLGSVALGAALGTQLERHAGAVELTTGLAFLAFAAWTIRGDAIDDDDLQKANRFGRWALLAVAGAFVLAELGDKTMLATVTLAARGEFVGTWIGSTLGMVAADALAVLAAVRIGRHLPMRTTAWLAAAAFTVIGLVYVADGLPHFVPWVPHFKGEL
jgi:putative Ca2+/H+ antiporter (TMEM165/GDT1 family)